MSQDSLDVDSLFPPFSVKILELSHCSRVLFAWNIYLISCKSIGEKKNLLIFRLKPLWYMFPIQNDEKLLLNSTSNNVEHANNCAKKLGMRVEGLIKGPQARFMTQIARSEIHCPFSIRITC